MDGPQHRIDSRRRALILGASAALLPLRAYAQGADAYPEPPSSGSACR
jgi:hypothetical protein